MWARVTGWLRARWPWVAAIGAGLVAIVALFTRRRHPSGPSAPAVVTGLSPEQAQAARGQAQATRDAEVAAAGADLQGSLSAIEAARARKRGAP